VSSEYDTGIASDIREEAFQTFLYIHLMKIGPHMAAMFFKNYNDLSNLSRWSSKDYYFLPNINRIWQVVLEKKIFSFL